APLRQLRHGICVAKMLDKTSSIICAFGLASAAPRSPYRHLELCGIAHKIITAKRRRPTQQGRAAALFVLCFV
ncbi:MAG: hypothetical protein MR806_10350, partial [Subdoligranulum sp.]|nr:hypothetical protein [Subdoligranulum sp.]